MHALEVPPPSLLDGKRGRDSAVKVVEWVPGLYG